MFYRSSFMRRSRPSVPVLPQCCVIKLFVMFPIGQACLRMSFHDALESPCISITSHQFDTPACVCHSAETAVFAR